VLTGQVVHLTIDDTVHPRLGVDVPPDFAHRERPLLEEDTNPGVLEVATAEGNKTRKKLGRAEGFQGLSCRLLPGSDGMEGLPFCRGTEREI